MRFPPSILEEIRARLPVSSVVGRRVKLIKAGREFKGLSPFNAEKSPSFFVNDQKGFYHDFSSGKHGDIFTFLMETEGLAFPEAVERLALGSPRRPLVHERHRHQRQQHEQVMVLHVSHERAVVPGQRNDGQEQYRLIGQHLQQLPLRLWYVGPMFRHAPPNVIIPDEFKPFFVETIA